MSKPHSFPWTHWCVPCAAYRAQVGNAVDLHRPGMWTSMLDPCPRCGQPAPMFPPIDPEYFDKKREELKDEYRAGLDSPPE